MIQLLSSVWPEGEKLGGKIRSVAFLSQDRFTSHPRFSAKMVAPSGTWSSMEQKAKWGCNSAAAVALSVERNHTIELCKRMLSTKGRALNSVVVPFSMVLFPPNIMTE